jgi:hypothetical protein
MQILYGDYLLSDVYLISITFLLSGVRGGNYATHLDLLERDSLYQ